ncbi:MAG TPA: pyridoxamine 5'-phosphate oxidase [Actinomycetota bacterium]|nr:pyridoxamine 5'-phosphate oxidase [Actinomycetota bacterium]
MLDVQDLAGTWLAQFTLWMEEVVQAGPAEPYAMVLATATPDGKPSIRSVLLRGVDESGFVCHTNYNSRKGREVAVNPRASLLFPWYSLSRQVVVDGRVERVSAEESDDYFASRPHGSKLGALASPQSEVIRSRSVLEDRHRALSERYPPGTQVPRPEHWGGLRIVPDSVEFWQARPNRLHDRLRYRREADRWLIERLAP